MRNAEHSDAGHALLSASLLDAINLIENEISTDRP